MSGPMRLNVFCILTITIVAQLEKHKSLEGNTKHSNLHLSDANLYQFRLYSHSIVLNLYSISINDIIIMKFISVKEPQNLNSMQ